MKKLSCIIVDDEPVARKILQEFVEQVPFIDLQGKFENAMKTEEFLKNNTTDIIFLDIEMPKVSGLQLLQKMNVESMVIITTAFPQYALDGYELDIIDYLLKPFALSRFLKAVHKAKDYFEMKTRTTGTLPPSYIFIKSEKRIEKIELNDILYAESVGNYVTVYTERKKIMAYLTMKSLESQLPSNDFIKIHQSYLVNCSKIDAIEGNEIKIGSRSLPISRNYREMVMKIIQQRLLKR
ncbi:LytTR family two component transcriptional regulator [Chitinophaga niastensis]|uniref:LytTR family two component transcriptional regulator n=1 Tax=Chitinophaga niastensis TaxID=536980 RepID=A0A2P8HUV9_CHINA|nr:LytTR family DNA-binding domain-containing protein [Chitinophaga niastensis]PSL49998.1 LytTR family two component transcriptional regulator [Chitinophaga niastensis]